MPHSSSSYISLLIIVLLAATVPVIVKKLRFPIPIVVGEILAGMIVGKAGFNLIEAHEWLEFLSTFGFAFLMFLSGLEIDFELIQNTTDNQKIRFFRRPVFLAISVFSLTLLLSSGVAYFLENAGLIKNIPIMALILSTTSLGIVVPVLKEKDLLSVKYGQTILLAALIADFATMLLITVYVTFYTSGITYELLLILILFLAFFVFYRLGIRIVQRKFITELAHATAQIQVRGAFALILIFIALSQSLGYEIIFGAFLAGVIVSLLKAGDSSQLHMKFDAIGYGFFVPIFFIMVGANFNLKSVIGNPNAVYLLPILIVSVYLVKLIPALLLKINHTWKEVLGAGFLLSSRLSLIIAASAIGYKLGVISETVNASIILVALITCTFSPLLFEPFASTATMFEREAIFMIGINERILLLAQRLKKLGFEVILVTNSKDRYEKALASHEKAFIGNVTDIQWLESIGIRTAKTVVVSMLNDQINAKICSLCNEKLGISNVVLITNSQSAYHACESVSVITPEFSTIFMAENLITHPKTFGLFLDEDDDLYITEVIVRNPIYFDRKLRSLKLPGDSLILSILRNGEKIIPHGNNVIKKADLIMLVGTTEYVKKARNLLGRKL